MLDFLIRRAAISIVTLFVISLIVFTGVRMIPGDPARVMGGTDADAAGLAEIRQKYGLDAPIPVQYLRWVGLALRGDLGESIRTRESVVWTVARKLPITMELAGLSLLVALGIAIPAGVFSAVRRNSVWDFVVNAVSLCGLSVPSFWLGIMLILFFSVRLGWLPASGFIPFLENPRANLTRMLMPAFHRSHIEAVRGQMVETIERRLGNWRIGQEVNLLSEMKSLTLAVAVRSILGLDPEREGDRVRLLMERWLRKQRPVNVYTWNADQDVCLAAFVLEHHNMLERAEGTVAEVEMRYAPFELKGTTRLGVWLTNGFAGSYADAVTLSNNTGADITLTQNLIATTRFGYFFNDLLIDFMCRSGC